MTIVIEAKERGYNFDGTKIPAMDAYIKIMNVTSGQMGFEFIHLKAKLEKRDPARLITISTLTEPLPHPLFNVVGGGVEGWEKV